MVLDVGTLLCDQCIERQGQVTCAPDNHTPEEYNAPYASRVRVGFGPTRAAEDGWRGAGSAP
jgi:hypothetical protein